MQYVLRRRGEHDFDFLANIRDAIHTKFYTKIPEWYSSMVNTPPYKGLPCRGRKPPKIVFPEDLLRHKYQYNHPKASPTMVDMFVRRQWALMDQGYSKVISDHHDTFFSICVLAE
jgi:hypothetical protein